MGIFNRLPVVSGGLITLLDAGNSSSYIGTGNIWRDVSGNNNHATIFNSPTYSTQNGGYFVMNGTNNYITPSTSVLATNTTQMLWYKWNGVNQAAGLSILGNGSSTGYGMYMNNGTNSPTVGNRISGLIAANSYNGGGSTSGLSSINWSHITMIRNTVINSMQLYVNGILDGSGNTFAFGADTVLSCLLYTSPSPRDYAASRMPSSA